MLKQERVGEIHNQLVGLRDIMPSVLEVLELFVPEDVSGKIF